MIRGVRSWQIALAIPCVFHPAVIPVHVVLLSMPVCAVGVFKDHAEGVRKMVHIRKEFTPDAQRKAKYDQIYEVYKELIKAAWPIWEKISTYGIEKWEK
jgi:hypothetical protein